MEKRDSYHGNLVAFEGPADAVSSQLRLLPASPQVLILPGIQTYMTRGDESRFSARTLIRNAHKAAQARHDAALRFLRESSANNRRIVFLSGGTASAVSQCISTISDHQAPGDFQAAESIFRDIVRGGVKSLDWGEKYSDPRTLQMLSRDEDDAEEQCWGNDEIEDPITKAMRAADALYEETESLQPIDYFTRSRPRSLSLPMYGHADGTGEPSPFFVFGSPPNQEDRLDSNLGSGDPANSAVEEDFTEVHCIRTQHGNSEGHMVLDRQSNCVGEFYQPHTAEKPPTMQLLSPTLDSILSPPATPDGVVYGEAQLVQMRASSTNKPLRTTRSLEDLELQQARQRHKSSDKTAQVPKRAAISGVLEAKSRHLSIVEDPYSSNSLFHLPQARFVKAHTTTIRKPPTFQKRLPKPARASYVHRGTDAADLDNERHVLDELCQPVLPLTEDLVIHFVGETHDPILDSVIQSFKSGSLPVSPFSRVLTQTERADSCSSTAMITDLSSSRDQAWLPRVTEYPLPGGSKDYDPFISRRQDVRSSNLVLQTPRPPPSAASVYIGQLPTPSQTPPPVPEKTETRFHDLSMAGSSNAVSIQNALRSVLKTYFPCQKDGGTRHFSHCFLPDMDSLWSPIFRGNEAHGNKMSGRSTDLILAIGCQRGVKRDFLPALMGQIEKLGAKSGGVSRSGRLDIRYLIANAMQSFTAQPLTQQTHNNPFENPYLLACLIIPHLETYLLTHSRIRFLLLEYPAEHLATVLALQKLVGNKVVKVTGIIDSEATSPTSDVPSPSSSTYSSTSFTVFNKINNSSLDSINLGSPSFPDNKSSLAHRRNYSFSKANYLLTCSATEAEIAVFISTIWKLLIEVDSFYIPERSPSHGSRQGMGKSAKGTITGAAPLPRLMSKLTIHGRGNNSPVYTHTPPITPHYVNNGEDERSSSSSTPWVPISAAALAHDFPFAPPPPRSISPSPSTTSTMSRERGIPGYTPGHRPRSRSVTRRRLGRAAEGRDDGASLYAMSVVEDGEFYDDEERRLMPMYMRQKDFRKGNSQKALKWLGLA